MGTPRADQEVGGVCGTWWSACPCRCNSTTTTTCNRKSNDGALRCTRRRWGERTNERNSHNNSNKQETCNIMSSRKRNRLDGYVIRDTDLDNLSPPSSKAQQPRTVLRYLLVTAEETSPLRGGMYIDIQLGWRNEQQQQ